MPPIKRPNRPPAVTYSTAARLVLFGQTDLKPVASATVGVLLVQALLGLFEVVIELRAVEHERPRWFWGTCASLCAALAMLLLRAAGDGPSPQSSISRR